MLVVCTRVVYLGTGERIVTGRSMDWEVEIGTNLWVFPRGVTRSGSAGPGSVTWTSTYGSVVASGYDISTTDGVNEAGLATNLLWLATLHLALSDASGDSAIVEYIDGEQVIHHGREYQVMTNSPIFDKQPAITEYWNQIGGTAMLPCTNRAADRFVRASFHINAVPKTADPSRPSPWRSVSCATPRCPTGSALSPSTFWVDLANFDFSEGGQTLRLMLGVGQKTVYTGEANAEFEKAEAFTFLGVA